MTGTLDLGGLLDALGYFDNEWFQLCSKASEGPFVTAVHRPAERLVTVPLDRDVWFGVNPVAESWDGGRPAAADVTRLAAVWADLDVKERGCPSFDVAAAIVAELSGFLGSRPVAVTYSGHGLQPIWAVEDGTITTEADGPDGMDFFTHSDARALLRRWGRLVAAVAERRGAAVDSVFDLPRILRCPGSVNHKGEPIPVVTLAEPGAPVTVERILEALDEWGIPDRPEDHADPGAVVSAPAEWTWREESSAKCGYIAGMVSGWAKDDPTDRHPWLVNHATRIACLHRNGCLTEAERSHLIDKLVERFRQLLSRDGTAREPGPGEIADALAWGQQKAAAKPADQMASEFGRHVHSDAPMDTPPIKAPPRSEPMDELAERRQQRTPTTDGTTALKPAPVDTMLLSEDGNAEALIRAHGHGIRYCHERGRWLLWNGHRWLWQPSGGGHVRELAKDCARRLPSGDWRKRSLSAVGISNALTQASTDERVVVTLDQLDADPWALNTPEGIIDLRTGVISPPDPAALCTRVTNATPDSDNMEAWHRFLDVTFGGDQELIGYLQRLVGYSATGHIGPHVLPFAHGSGGNGKGVFLEAIARVLGDYATSAPNAFLMARQYGQHETEIARLAGARMVLCSEVNETDRFDEAKVKQLTGGDTLTARFMRQDHFTFTPTHHLWLMGNHKPAVTSGGRSFWRRCRLIPFRHEVDEADRVDDLQGILARTAGGAVLAWVAQGAAEYHRAGLREPESVIRATEEYAHDQDTVARFVDECCHLATSDQVKVGTRELLLEYERWCGEAGEMAVSAKRFGTDLRNRYSVGQTRSNGKRFYTGIAILKATEESDDEGNSDGVRRIPVSVADRGKVGGLF